MRRSKLGIANVPSLLAILTLGTACDNSGGEAPRTEVAGAAGAGGVAPSSGGTATAGAGRGGTDGGSASTEVGGSGGVPGSSGATGTAGVGGATSGTGGESAGAGAGAGNAGDGNAGGANEAFTLAWQDDFDTLDSSRWALQTFSFDGNLAQFSTENASVANGVLSIALTPAPDDTAKPYRGVELRSVDTLTYGKVEARIRFAKGSGVVSSLVLIYTPWPADDWNEIDIEHLGKQPNGVQTNCMVYTGAPTTPPVTQSVAPTQDPELATLGFDAEADFHVYTIEWTPVDVRFSVDGALLRTWTAEIGRMKLAQNILFTIWASNAPTWAGAITPESAPTTADIDWIKVYDFNGPAL